MNYNSKPAEIFLQTFDAPDGDVSDARFCNNTQQCSGVSGPERSVSLCSALHKFRAAASFQSEVAEKKCMGMFLQNTKEKLSI